MQEKIDPVNVVPKDKGWAWMCLLGTTSIHFVIGGVCVNTFGILFKPIQDRFDASAKDITWVPAIMLCLLFLTATPANLLCRRIGTRRVVFISGLLLNIGYAMTAFVQKLWMVYVTYGLLVGVGVGLCYGPSVVVIGTYFEKRRALANGMTFAASSLGTFCFSPLIKYCLACYGLQGTLLIIGGILFHISAAGMLFRPEEFYQLPRKVLINQRILRSDRNVFQSNKSAHVNPSSQSESPLGPFENSKINSTSTVACHGATRDSDGINTRLAHHGTTTAPYSNIAENKRCAAPTPSPTSNSKEHTVTDVENPANTRLQKSASQWNILKHPLLYIYALTLPISDSSFINSTMMIHPYATDNDISNFNAAFLISIMGLSSGASRFLVGFFSDYNFVKKKYIYQAATLANGVVLCLFPLTVQYRYLAVMSGLSGFFTGAAVLLAPVLVAEGIGTSDLPVAVGVLYSTSGGVILGSAVLMGFLRDMTGQWNDSFYVMGSLGLVAAIVNLAEPWASNWGHKHTHDTC